MDDDSVIVICWWIHDLIIYIYGWGCFFSGCPRRSVLRGALGVVALGCGLWGVFWVLGVYACMLYVAWGCFVLWLIPGPPPSQRLLSSNVTTGRGHQFDSRGG